MVGGVRWSCSIDFKKRLLGELPLDSSRLIFALSSHSRGRATDGTVDSSLPGSELLGPWMERVCTRPPFPRLGGRWRMLTRQYWTGTPGGVHLLSVRDIPDPDPAADRMICGFNPESPTPTTCCWWDVSRSPSGTVRATLVNYACHPTTLAWENTTISPDFIGAMRETIEGAVGATAFFLQGMSGDLAPRHQYVGDVEVADRHGRQLGFAALATLNDMEPAGNQLCFDGVVESGAPLAVWRHRQHEPSSELRALEVTADLKLKDWPTAEELEQQRLACHDRARRGTPAAAARHPTFAG